MDRRLAALLAEDEQRAAARGAVTDADIDALPLHPGAVPDPFAEVPQELRGL